jgi:hypothetical protein
VLARLREAAAARGEPLGEARSPHLHGIARIRLSGHPWSYADDVRELLAARFGAPWHYHSDDAE